MRLPSSYLHFGPTTNINVTVGTSQYQDQADKCKELKKWMTQQEEELRRIYGEEVEILPSPLLLQEMEGARGRQPTPVSPAFIPGRIHSSLHPTVSPKASELSTLTATSSGPFTPAAASVESSTSATTPESTEFPAGFGSRPGWRRSRRAVVFGEVRTDASYPSTEGPSAMVSSQLLSPELVGGHPAPSAGHQSPVQPPALNWVQARLEKMKEDFMKGRCCDFVLHLMDHPEDLNLVHSVLQAEFIVEGWLDAPAPLSPGGPFDSLLVAIRAAQSSKDSEPQPTTVKLHEPQHAAKPLDLWTLQH
ncbi:hypothetical protein AMECASPLE_025325 [Ameca splendens]|uniref:Uncharacterized protein n=1 Tax=Ameca splendens TaxID=208324 RepID=A0ABV0YRK5_9TELE